MLDFLTALGLFFVIEGLLYAAAPFVMKTLALQALRTTDSQLRVVGVIALGFGVGLIWLVRGGL